MVAQLTYEDHFLATCMPVNCFSCHVLQCLSISQKGQSKQGKQAVSKPLLQFDTLQGTAEAEWPPQNKNRHKIIGRQPAEPCWSSQRKIATCFVKVVLSRGSWTAYHLLPVCCLRQQKAWGSAGCPRAPQAAPRLPCGPVFATGRKIPTLQLDPAVRINAQHSKI